MWKLWQQPVRLIAQSGNEVTLKIEVNLDKIQRPPQRHENWYFSGDKHTLYRGRARDFYAVLKKIDHTSSNMDLRKHVYQFTEELQGNHPGI